MKKNIIGNTMESTAVYLTRLNATLAELKATQTLSTDYAIEANQEAATWQSRMRRAESMKDRAETPNGEKSMEILQRQAEIYFEVAKTKKKNAEKQVQEVDTKVHDIVKVINELESLNKMGQLESRMGMLEAKMVSDGSTKTGGTPLSFDARKVDQLVYEAQALISLEY